ncbi:hypothetical protein A2300_01685 [Candidatus Falkowbacteria bacterium RIFOXYB2_FULL_35_7]|uniref:EamA domain-containing protein n=1 Tax=Candidatus Falkowbacteria bacterium RIFOXYC2_FULL_36_12 TaxID=1798002 RepID=A0A1F5SYL0_9BACT|nr:MAG: hypothetical protein A2300_01685 [Candidatus Falkowbacteria bacterium RIFOXYB2_FULL_35_7]OGF31780.1 MAG: hypothetical protein A2478_04825 [Candidatus Falkowbacteria bacterium RIFOXYC2_FULL_36_12]
MIFLRLNIFILLFIVYTLSLAMIYSIYWSHKIIWAKSKLFIFIVPLILLELFWAVSYLPFNYYVNGILMAVFLYVLVGLGKLFLQESLNKKQIINYLVVAVISIILIVFSAQWS